MLTGNVVVSGQPSSTSNTFGEQRTSPSSFGKETEQCTPPPQDPSPSSKSCTLQRNPSPPEPLAIALQDDSVASPTLRRLSVAIHHDKRSFPSPFGHSFRRRNSVPSSCSVPQGGLDNEPTGAGLPSSPADEAESTLRSPQQRSAPLTASVHPVRPLAAGEAAATQEIAIGLASAPAAERHGRPAERRTTNLGAARRRTPSPTAPAGPDGRRQPDLGAATPAPSGPPGPLPSSPGSSLAVRRLQIAVALSTELADDQGGDSSPCPPQWPFALPAATVALPAETDAGWPAGDAGGRPPANPDEGGAPPPPHPQGGGAG